MKKKYINYTFLIIFVLAFNFAVSGQKTEYSRMVDSIIEKTIPTIGSKTLFTQINYHVPLIILDAREKEEFNVSHITDAILVGFEDFNLDTIQKINNKKKIVVYCSVGFRSEKVAEILKQNGYSDVYNLYGGIFDWVNNGYEVVDSAGVTQNIHPYNEEWGSWLEKGVRKYE